MEGIILFIINNIIIHITTKYHIFCIIMRYVHFNDYRTRRIHFFPRFFFGYDITALNVNNQIEED